MKFDREFAPPPPTADELAHEICVKLTEYFSKNHAHLGLGKEAQLHRIREQLYDWEAAWVRQQIREIEEGK